jgi:hypothetical protein
LISESHAGDTDVDTDKSEVETVSRTEKCQRIELWQDYDQCCSVTTVSVQAPRTIDQDRPASKVVRVN